MHKHGKQEDDRKRNAYLRHQAFQSDVVRQGTTAKVWSPLIASTRNALQSEGVYDGSVIDPGRIRSVEGAKGISFNRGGKGAWSRHASFRSVSRLRTTPTAARSNSLVRPARNVMR